jgi:hypothetical protein
MQLVLLSILGNHLAHFVSGSELCLLYLVLSNILAQALLRLSDKTVVSDMRESRLVHMEDLHTQDTAEKL